MTEEEEKKKKEAQKLPVRPRPDFTLADQFAKISKNCELASYYCKLLPWLLIPFGIGLCAGGFALLGPLLLVLGIFSYIGSQICSEYKDNFEQAMLKEEKAAVAKNEPKLQAYYEQCAELGIDPNQAPAKSESKQKNKQMPKATINMSSKQVAEALAKQTVKSEGKKPEMEHSM